MIRRSPASGNPELALDATSIVSFFEQVTESGVLRKMVQRRKRKSGADRYFGKYGSRVVGVQACWLQRFAGMQALEVCRLAPRQRTTGKGWNVGATDAPGDPGNTSRRSR
jgi:hypothetical protein